MLLHRAANRLIDRSFAKLWKRFGSNVWVYTLFNWNWVNFIGTSNEFLSVKLQQLFSLELQDSQHLWKAVSAERLYSNYERERESMCVVRARVRYLVQYEVYLSFVETVVDEERCGQQCFPLLQLRQRITNCPQKRVTLAVRTKVHCANITSITKNTVFSLW